MLLIELVVSNDDAQRLGRLEYSTLNDQARMEIAFHGLVASSKRRYEDANLSASDTSADEDHKCLRNCREYYFRVC